MSYKHILVAVDLTPESRILIDKCIGLAKPLGADVSFIHVEANYEELCRNTGFIDVDLDDNRALAVENSIVRLKELTEEVDYPVKHCLAGTGEYSNELKNAIKRYEVDLVICGHHQDFWSAILSSTKQIMSNIPVDMLVIPLQD